MGRSVAKVVSLVFLVVAGWAGLYVLEKKYSPNAELNEERERRKAAEWRAEQLRQVVTHLQSEQRQAEIVVLDQEVANGEVQNSTLLFQEYDKNNNPLPPKLFKIQGDEAHVDAKVIKFQGKFVEDKDPLKGRSIVLFTKLFDNKQAPEKGYVIDDPNHIPAIYQGADPKVSEFEQKLWTDFWKLAQDKAYRDRMGVDVIQGKSVWWKFEPGQLYTLTTQPNADLVLRYEPMRPVYREMLKQWTSKLKAGVAAVNPLAPGGPPVTPSTESSR